MDTINGQSHRICSLLSFCEFLCFRMFSDEKVTDDMNTLYATWMCFGNRNGQRMQSTELKSFDGMELNETELFEYHIECHLMIAFQNQLFLRFMTPFTLIVLECGWDFTDFSKVLFTIIREDTLQIDHVVCYCDWTTDSEN